MNVLWNPPTTARVCVYTHRSFGLVRLIMQPPADGNEESQSPFSAEEIFGNSDDEDRARTDLTWNDASGTTTELPDYYFFSSMTEHVSLDKVLVGLMLNQRNLNRIVAMFCFSWIAEWMTFFAYVAFVYFSDSWFHMNEEPGSLADSVRSIFVFLLLAFQLVFYFTRVLSMIFFFVTGAITVYVCSVNRRAFRFSPIRHQRQNIGALGAGA